MSRFVGRSLAALVIGAALLAGGQPAEAAPRPVNITLTSSTTSVSQGSTVNLTGRAWQNQAGNRTTVSFYFQRRGTATWTTVGSATTNDRGDFTKPVRVSYTGTWKVVTQGTATRAVAAQVRLIQAYRTTARLLAGYQASADSWQGPTIRIPTADYRAYIYYNCTDPSGGFLYLHWNGRPDGFESVSSSKASGLLTLNGHSGARAGYFDVDTWMGCTWSLKVYSGTTRTLV